MRRVDFRLNSVNFSLIIFSIGFYVASTSKDHGTKYWCMVQQFEILLLFFIQFPANVLGRPIVQMTYWKIMTEKRQIHFVRLLKLIRKELWRLRQKIMVII